MRLRCALLGALLLTACGSGAPAPAVTPGVSATAARSGIDLVTVAGPTCPVQHAGQPCTRPISARVSVLQRGMVALTVQTGADGTARIPLPAGDYTLDGLAGENGLPRPPAPTAVTVDAGQFTRVQLEYDTGIR
jgi:hypothetical protein